MRKLTMMVATVALMVAMFATAAYAATVYCSSDPCFGTSGNDTMFDNYDPSGETIYGEGGSDHINADYYWGDQDDVFGGRGGDFLDAQDEDTIDYVNGGRGKNDICEVDRDTSTGQQDATRNCETVRVSNLD